MSSFHLPPDRVRVAAPAILVAVGQRYGLTPAELRLKTNRPEFSHPRQLAMFLLRQWTTLSFPGIGRFLGGFHHTTVQYACTRVAREVKRSEAVAALVRDIDAELTGPEQLKLKIPPQAEREFRLPPRLVSRPRLVNE